jgi:hypothetical protein
MSADADEIASVHVATWQHAHGDGQSAIEVGYVTRLAGLAC